MYVSTTTLSSTSYSGTIVNIAPLSALKPRVYSSNQSVVYDILFYIFNYKMKLIRTSPQTISCEQQLDISSNHNRINTTKRHLNPLHF